MAVYLNREMISVQGPDRDGVQYWIARWKLANANDSSMYVRRNELPFSWAGNGGAVLIDGVAVGVQDTAGVNGHKVIVQLMDGNSSLGTVLEPWLTRFETLDCPRWELTGYPMEQRYADGLAIVLTDAEYAATTDYTVTLWGRITSGGKQG